MKTHFGQYLRSLREARNLGLRQFARDVGLQPSNFSNIENGFLHAPGDAVLKRIAAALGLGDGTTERVKLFDLAAQSRTDIPLDIRDFISANPLVPAMLRSMKDKKLSRVQIQALLDDLDKLPEDLHARL
jgi:transcriptional regulator with XRE-family HTH domain